MKRSPWGLLAAAGTAVAVVASAGAAAAQPTTWNFEQAAVPGAQAPGAYGKGVLVAVVDTWVDPNQAEFGGRVIDEADCLPGSCQDHKYAPDSCVHGTHVAGTIASRDYGVAPEADILAVQVLSGPAGAPDPSAACSGSASTVATGIEFAVSKGAKVINLSVGDAVPGVFQSSAISNAVADAAAHGVVVVFAAGNQGIPLTDSYGHDVLLVAATGPSGQLAGYSNFNSVVTGNVSVAAPGGDSGNGVCSVTDCVLSTFPDDQLGLLEGTSMAAPHVSGLAALLLAQDPGRGVSGVVSAIEKTATPLAGAGAGLIDAARALHLEAASHPVTNGSSPTSSPTPSATSSPTAPATVRRSATPPVGTATPYEAGTPAVTAVPPSAPPSVTTVPVGSSTTAAPTTRAPDTGSRPVAGAAPRPAPAGSKAADWLGNHAAILVIACLLLAADLVVVLGMRKTRKLFGR